MASFSCTHLPLSFCKENTYGIWFDGLDLFQRALTQHHIVYIRPLFVSCTTIQTNVSLIFENVTEFCDLSRWVQRKHR